MKAHKNARTTPHSRQVLIERIGQGLPAWQVAQDLGVSRQTVQKWLARARAEGHAGLQDRSSRPIHSPSALPKAKLERITSLRQQRLTATQIAQRLLLPRSTVARHLRRLGMGQLPPLHPPPPMALPPATASLAASRAPPAFVSVEASAPCAPRLRMHRPSARVPAVTLRVTAATTAAARSASRALAPPVVAPPAAPAPQPTALPRATE